MRKILLSSLALVSLFSAENVASTADIKPLKEFSPPTPITPNTALSAMPENQFDRADRSGYYFVTNKLDGSSDSMHLSAGAYGSSFYSSALYRQREANFYTMLNAHYTKANDYKDGHGDKVGFGYKRYGQSLILGYLPSDISEIRATFLHDRIDADKQPQWIQDAMKTQRYVSRLNFRLGDEELGNTLNFELAYRDIKRVAGNYALRQTNPKNYVELNRKIFDVGAKYDYDDGAFHNLFGLNFTRDRHDGKRYINGGAGYFHVGNRFPKIDANIWKFYDTISYKFADAHSLSFGVDYVRNDAKTKSLDEAFRLQPTPLSPTITTRALWRQIYGRDFDGSIEQDAFSAALKYEFKPNEKDSFMLAFESLERIADNMERFNALHGAANNGWISNPFLEPERHNRVRAEFRFGSEAYKSYLNSMYNENSFALYGYAIADEVSDMIIYDRRHLGGGMNGNAVTSKNADARLFLSNFGAELNFAKKFGAKLDLFYSYGQNRDDDRPLYQMRPFEAKLQLDYRDYASFGSFNLGSALRYVGKQTRGDWRDGAQGFNIDLREAAKSFTTMDIYAGIEFRNKFGIRFGVNNIFDRGYAEFISGAHVGALRPSLVNAPGRTAWMSFHASF